MKNEIDQDIRLGTWLDGGKPALKLVGGGEKRDAVWTHWYGSDSLCDWTGISFSVN